MPVHRCKYVLGDTVYHRHATEREPMILTGVTFGANGGHIYACSWPDGSTTSHFECELVTEWRGYLPDDQQGEGD